MDMIETERLILREWRSDDLEPFARLNADERVCEFLPKSLSREESDAMAGRIRNHFDLHGYGLYAVEVKSSGTFVGFTGLSIPGFDAPFMPAVEIGWRLAFEAWGNGYASEAARAVLRHGVEVLDLGPIISFTASQNIRSRRVMEAIGLTRDPREDFDHPKLAKGHPLRCHVLYRLVQS